MAYIIIDLEWNQCPGGKAMENPKLPFEIVEIGAIKLDEERNVIGEFSKIVRPQVYRRFHYRTREIVHIDTKELREAEPFSRVVREFLTWCGEDCRFCTWGPLDLLELQRNMAFYGIESPFPFPLLYYDVQKMFSLLYEDGKTRRSLEDAVEYLEIEKEIPFHRAFDDTYYTAAVMKKMDWEKVEKYQSVDYYRLPASREEEITLDFGSYTKYVSRTFASREEALKDREVLSVRCRECGKPARRRIPWFGIGSRQCVSLSQCPEHGLIKGKLRIKKSVDDRTFIVKTLKWAGTEDEKRLKEQHERSRKRRSKSEMTKEG